MMNNSIWMCSNDWVDQFYNPAHQAQHHIHRRLKVNQDLIGMYTYFCSNLLID